jgi:hypothetical protein
MSDIIREGESLSQAVERGIVRLYPCFGIWCQSCTNPCFVRHRYGDPAAWICPKCGRVWGPYVRECEACNSQIADGTPATTAGGIE